jgi:hypothetical protein
MKPLTFLLLLALAAAIALFSGCSNLVSDLQSKTTNMSISGIGGTFSTVDPATGSVAPSVKLGTISASSMNHRPGDGTQVSIDTQKSLWSSEIGSQTIKINGGANLKGVAYSYTPGGLVTLSFDDGTAAAAPTSSKK